MSASMNQWCFGSRFLIGAMLIVRDMVDEVRRGSSTHHSRGALNRSSSTSFDEHHADRAGQGICGTGQRTCCAWRRRASVTQFGELSPKTTGACPTS